MSESQKRILEMLREQKLTVEEAERLLALVGQEQGGGAGAPGNAEKTKKQARYLRVVVTPDQNTPEASAEKVNIRVPVSLIRAGMKFTSLIPPRAADEVQNAMREKGVNFDLRNFKDSDIEDLIAALNDLEVDVDDRHGKKTVRVYTE